MGVGPVGGEVEAGAAVELARRAGRGRPRRRRPREVLQRAAARRGPRRSSARRRGQRVSSASWAISTVGSRVCGSRSNVRSRAAPQPVDRRWPRRPGRRRSARSSVAADASAGVGGALAERHQPAEHGPDGVATGRLGGRRTIASARPASAPVDAADRRGRRQRSGGRRRRGRTARPARTGGAAARRAGRRRRPRSSPRGRARRRRRRVRGGSGDRLRHLARRERRHRDLVGLDQLGEAGDAQRPVVEVGPQRRPRPAAGRRDR